MDWKWMGGASALYSAFLHTQSAPQWRGDLTNHHQYVAPTWLMQEQLLCTGGLELTLPQLEKESEMNEYK